MFLTVLTMTITTVNMNGVGSADSLERWYQRRVKHLFVAADSQQRCPARAMCASHCPFQKGMVSVASFSGAIWDASRFFPTLHSRGCQRARGRKRAEPYRAEPNRRTARRSPLRSPASPMCLRRWASDESVSHGRRGPSDAALLSGPGAFLSNGCPRRWAQGSRAEPTVPCRTPPCRAVQSPAEPCRGRCTEAPPGPATCGPLLPAWAGGGASPAPAPPPPGAARSNSHGNPGSTPFPNPASPPRPSAPARRPPPVGNSLCVNSTCPERCAPLPASLRARLRARPPRAMLDPSSSEEESDELLEEERRDVLVAAGGSSPRSLPPPPRDPRGREAGAARAASPSPSVLSEGREEQERLQREEREKRLRLQLYVFIARCIAHPFNAKQPTDMARRQQKVSAPPSPLPALQPCPARPGPRGPPRARPPASAALWPATGWGGRGRAGGAAAVPQRHCRRCQSRVLGSFSKPARLPRNPSVNRGEVF